MNILLLDDEWAALEELRRVVGSVVKDAGMFEASTAAEALEAARHNRIDIAFLDIQLPDKDGLEVARELLVINPHMNIIMQTANPQFALDAYRLYVCDFLVKPISAVDVRNALEHLRWPVDGAIQKLEVKCFGKFEVFWNGKPLQFQRRRTLELFAYLVDREGVLCTLEQIAVAMWEEIDDMNSAKNNIRNCISDLRQTIEAIGMGDALIRRRAMVAIDRNLVDCDYFRYLDGTRLARESFHGEYMVQYSWAEETQARLQFETGI